jgi:hypothetical protein
MNIEAEKLDLISWISILKDIEILNQMINIKRTTVQPKNIKRKFGCGKGIITYISEDFNEPLEEFKEYTN